MLKKRINQIPRLLMETIDILITCIVSIFIKNKKEYENSWLISERGTEAKDNGYAFFKYLRENNPEINVYYVIDKNFKQDYNKVKDLGNIIQYRSLQHKIAFMLCEKAISSHTGFLEPWSYKLYKIILDRKSKKKYIFLQHGIINHDVSEFYNKKATRIDLFITSTQKEFESIDNNPNYGYKCGQVVKTGLARFDNLYQYDKEYKNQILLMPTWRKEIVSPSYIKKKINRDDIFLSSEYFKTFNSLINNKELNKILLEKNIELIFYPHYEIQQYLKFFKTECKNIKIASKEKYDVQTLIKESKLLITDYSSVFFDFGYMMKPLIYYHFDKGHYKNGYFDHRKDGFGDICKTEEELIEKTKNMLLKNICLEDKYKERIKAFFDLRDDRNCERIYNQIIKM